MERVLPPERFGLRLRNKEVNESSSLFGLRFRDWRAQRFLNASSLRVFKFATGESAISSSLNLVKTSPGQLGPGQLLCNEGVVPPDVPSGA